MKSNNKQKGGFLAGILTAVAVAAAIVVAAPTGGGSLALLTSTGTFTGLGTAVVAGAGIAGSTFGNNSASGGAAVGPDGKPLTPEQLAAQQAADAAAGQAGPMGANGAACSSLRKTIYQEQQQYTGLQQQLEQARAAGAAQASGQTAAAGTANSCTSPSTAALQACESNSDASNKDCSDPKNYCEQVATFIQSTQSAICAVQGSNLSTAGGGTNATSTGTSTLPTAFLTATSTRTLISTSTVLAIVGDTVSYTWGSTNADTFSSTFSSDSAACGTQKNSATARGYDSGIVAQASAGCTYFVSFTAINSSTGQSASALLTLKIGTSTANNTTGNGAFTLYLNPSTVYQGNNVSISANINDASVQSYSIKALQNGQILGYLSSAILVGTTQRPTTIQKIFNTSASTPPGTYTIQISSDQNTNVSQSANLTVLPGNGQTTQTTTTTNNPTYGNTQTGNTVSNTTTSTGGSCRSIANNLQYGSSDSTTGGQVSALQSFLVSKGFLTMPTGTPMGYFGGLTKTAVKNFQAAFGISSTGYVGPLTRAQIKAMCN